VHLLGPPPPHTHTRTPARTRLADPPPFWLLAGTVGSCICQGSVISSQAKVWRESQSPVSYRTAAICCTTPAWCPPPPPAHTLTHTHVRWLLARKVGSCDCEGFVFPCTPRQRFGGGHGAPSLTGPLPFFTQPQRGGASPTPLHAHSYTHVRWHPPLSAFS
jgi:hypothetical protein